jgi:ligand-binding sensor domain-containing protein
MQDKSRKIWFATVNGVYTYDGETFTSFKVNEGSKGFMSDKNNV